MTTQEREKLLESMEGDDYSICSLDRVFEKRIKELEQTGDKTLLEFAKELSFYYYKSLVKEWEECMHIIVQIEQYLNDETESSDDDAHCTLAEEDKEC